MSIIKYVSHFEIPCVIDDQIDIEANILTQASPPVEQDRGILADIPHISLLPFSMIFFPAMIILALTRK